MKHFSNFFIGILIGMGAILPGVSSGVFCVIFGIYEKLVNSIVCLFKDFKKNVLFLLPIALGAIVGIVLFGNIIKFLFDKYKMQACFVFIGLILGTVPSLFKQATQGIAKVSKCINVKKIIPMIVSFIIGIDLIFLENNLNNSLVSNSVMPSLAYLIFAGFAMSIGIVVPGVSNTIILMCLGIYPLYLSAIATLNFEVLLPMCIGVFFGCILWLKIIQLLLKKYHEATFYAIIGFTLGSILVLYPGLTFNVSGLFAIVLLILSTIISYKLSTIEQSS